MFGSTIKALTPNEKPIAIRFAVRPADDRVSADLAAQLTKEEVVSRLGAAADGVAVEVVTVPAGQAWPIGCPIALFFVLPRDQPVIWHGGRLETR